VVVGLRIHPSPSLYAPCCTPTRTFPTNLPRNDAPLRGGRGGAVVVFGRNLHNKSRWLYLADTILQFIFYIGLYKVTAMMYNPFDVHGAQFDLHEYIFVWCTITSTSFCPFLTMPQRYTTPHGAT